MTTISKELFLHALTPYYQESFTYVEVGDGDELWKNRKFSDVRRAHIGMKLEKTTVSQ